jgi:hypothetical protein
VRHEGLLRFQLNRVFSIAPPGTERRIVNSPVAQAAPFDAVREAGGLT